MKIVIRSFLLVVLLLSSLIAEAQISGPATACVGTSATLSDATGGGVWSSSSTAIAVVGSGSGIVTGVAKGTATISYVTGVSTSTVVMTIYDAPFSMKGAPGFCEHSTSFLVDSGGNTWSSSNTAVLVIDSSIEPSISLAFVTTLAPGTATVTFTTTKGCMVVKTFTVSPMPSAITGPGVVCVGGSVTLSNASPGGIWTVSDPTLGSIDSVTGVLTGLAEGGVPVNYTIGACAVYGGVTVKGKPSPTYVEAGSDLCIGKTFYWSNIMADTAWYTSSNPAAATITDIGLSAQINGISEGTTVISFWAANNCGTRDTSATITVANCAVAVNQVPVVAYKMHIVPNPNNGSFTFRLVSISREAVHVVGSDLFGRGVADLKTITNEFDEISLNEPAGTYLLSAFTAQGTYKDKIIIVR